MSERKAYVYCCVPSCKSTSRKTPDKYFFVVPNNPERRRRWFLATRRKHVPSATSKHRICEDHFNFATDLRNYHEHRLTKVKPLLKDDAVPSKYECQGMNTLTVARSSSEKRSRRKLVNYLIAVDSVGSCLEDDTATVGPPMEILLHPDDLVSTCEEFVNPTAEAELNPVMQAEQGKRGPKQKVSHFRSRGVQASPRMEQQSSSPMKNMMQDIALSPVKTMHKLEVDDVFSSSSNSDLEDSSLSDCSWSPDSDDSEDYDNNSFRAKKESLYSTRYYDKMESMTYLGIPSESFFVVDMMAHYVSYKGLALHKQDIICIILRKIRMNLSFKILSHQYGVGESHVVNLFHTYLPVVSKLCETFIKMASPSVVKVNAPLAFWARFRECYMIVDAFEIKIERPGDPERQAATWSEYKKGNTLKYIIGISPDGTIMFVSAGYGGRTSDMCIFNDSGLVNALPCGTSILADRGFKGLEAILLRKGVTLIRPPSIEGGKIFDKVEALATKRIAAVRIHVERSIARVREFSILAAHSTIDHSLMDRVDNFVSIACGLVNIQSPLVKI